MVWFPGLSHRLIEHHGSSKSRRIYFHRLRGLCSPLSPRPSALGLATEGLAFYKRACHTHCGLSLCTLKGKQGSQGILYGYRAGSFLRLWETLSHTQHSAKDTVAHIKNNKKNDCNCQSSLDGLAYVGHMEMSVLNRDCFITSSKSIVVYLNSTAQTHLCHY